MTQKIATLRDLESWWSIDDVMKTYAMLDLNSDIAQERRKKAKDVNRKIATN